MPCRVRAGVLLASSAVALGCEPITGVDFDAVERRAPACTPATPPDPPRLSGGADDFAETVVLVGADYGEGEDDAGPRFLTQGYDLDQSCSSAAEPPPCESPAWVGADLTDGSEGQDNGIARMLDGLGPTLFTSQQIEEYVDQGVAAPIGLVRISGYSGFFSDDRVAVEWYVPVAPAELEQGAFVPALDGSDVWPVVADYVDEDDNAVFVDEEAYVTDSLLVARFPTARLSVLGRAVEVTNIVFTVTIVQEQGVTELRDGLVAGSVSMAAILAQLPEITTRWYGYPICHDTPEYRELKPLLCVAADLGESAGGDCDEASFGLRFQARHVELGPAVSLAEPPPLCDSEPLVADTCEEAPEP